MNITNKETNLLLKQQIITCVEKIIFEAFEGMID
jgi:hypothetical protein